MFDFPVAPANGSTFTPPGGPTYVYQAPVWLLQSGGSQAAVPSDTAPIMDSVAAPGVSLLYARGDHVHPTNSTATNDTTTDWDTLITPGLCPILLGGGNPNAPEPTGLYFCETFVAFGSPTQIAIPYGLAGSIAQGLWYRGSYAGVWGSWQHILSGIMAPPKRINKQSNGITIPISTTYPAGPIWSTVVNTVINNPDPSLPLHVIASGTPIGVINPAGTTGSTIGMSAELQVNGGALTIVGVTATMTVLVGLSAVAGAPSNHLAFDVPPGGSATIGCFSKIQSGTAWQTGTASGQIVSFFEYELSY